MKEKNLAHIGSLLGGVVHNLNTPLMWVMGRAQLLQARNDQFEKLKSLSDEEFAKVKEKNDKDITSILEGADKIDFILKGLSYKIQMVNEGYTSVEIREYLDFEINFLMADMRFKHDTKREINLGPKSYYAKVDFNSLSGAITGIINAMINNTEKGRTLKISLENGILHFECPELKPNEKTHSEIDEACKKLQPEADIIVDEKDHLKVTIALKGL